MTTLAATWQSTKVVRTREKISFFMGVMAVAVTALMFGLAPSYVQPSSSNSLTHPLLSPKDGSILPIQSALSSSSLCVLTPIKRNPGTTFCLTSAITPTSSASFTFGSSRPVPPCSYPHTASHTVRSPARSSRGAIVSCFMILTKSRRYSFICTPLSHSL